MLGFIVTQSKAITLLLNGKSHNVSVDSPKYVDIVNLLKRWQAEPTEREEIESLIQTALSSQCETLMGKHVEMRDGKVFYGDVELHNVLVDRILEIDKLGLPCEPMLKFLENILSNPSEDSRNELYDFLQHKNLPITEDGCFLAYKAVRSDFKDIYSGKIDNSVGQVVRFDRREVDDDRNHECSYGLHVGAIDYVRWYGRPNSRFVIVKINPRDAVSVPRDHHAQKLRVCQYEVIMEVSRETVLDYPVYSSDGQSYQSMADYNNSRVWDEDDYYDDEEEQEYLDYLWEDEDDDEWTPEEKDDFLKDQVRYYDETYNRDDLCRLAKSEGVVLTVEAAREMGKQAVCSLLASRDLEFAMKE